MVCSLRSWEALGSERPYAVESLVCLQFLIIYEQGALHAEKAALLFSTSSPEKGHLQTKNWQSWCLFPVCVRARVWKAWGRETRAQW